MVCLGVRFDVKFERMKTKCSYYPCCSLQFFYFYFLGVEDGQTVRVPVEAGELFVTFRVGSRLLNNFLVF